MAKTTNSVQYAEQLEAAANFNAIRSDNRQFGGAMQYAHVVVEFLPDAETGDVIQLLELPSGAMIFKEHSVLFVPSFITTEFCTIDVGNSNGQDVIAYSIDASSGGRKWLSQFPGTVMVNAQDGSNLIKATITHVSGTLYAGFWNFCIAYKTP